MVTEHKVNMHWGQLSRLMARAGILSPRQEISSITLVKPCTLLIVSAAPDKPDNTYEVTVLEEYHG